MSEREVSAGSEPPKVSAGIPDPPPAPFSVQDDGQLGRDTSERLRRRDDGQKVTLRWMLHQAAADPGAYLPREQGFSMPDWIAAASQMAASEWVYAKARELVEPAMQAYVRSLDGSDMNRNALADITRASAWNSIALRMKESG